MIGKIQKTFNAIRSRKVTPEQTKKRRLQENNWQENVTDFPLVVINRDKHLGKHHVILFFATLCYFCQILQGLGLVKTAGTERWL